MRCGWKLNTSKTLKVRSWLELMPQSISIHLLCNLWFVTTMLLPFCDPGVTFNTSGLIRASRALCNEFFFVLLTVGLSHIYCGPLWKCQELMTR